MKNKKYFKLIISLGIIFCLCAFYRLIVRDNFKPYYAKNGTKIYLLGETHAKKKLLDKEFEIWNEKYKLGNRHLFIESPYYTGQYLNIWMKEPNDEYFNLVFNNLKGTSFGDNEYVKGFYKKIKMNCPETIFHGTDVGHQFYSTGESYKKFLEDKGLTNSKEYERTIKNIEQGELYYKSKDESYREKEMAENFITDYKELNGIEILGIYGKDHCNQDYINKDGKGSMFTLLKEKLGDIINSESVSDIK